MSVLPSDPLQCETRALLDLHLDMLNAYARHLVGCGGDADDIIQDVCLEVLAHPGMLLRGDDPGAYLRGIARHLSSRHRRRFYRHQALEDLIDLSWSTDDDAEHQAHSGRVLRACLAGLNARLRHMVELRYQYGLNATEIGGRLVCSADAVRMALARGRQALARCLDKRLDGGGSP